ncbi:hypothetical protein QA601_04035 [Chitinispirillales bacterium ANBcel5]|uniref:hypothetical protein n=1 Tax=Cellulosispirillum alkaliphilum TaxID=3039283 RepID=UPI002A58AF76|nr:hypothetical protein [Chitinispirillales bacterium ANBcel5]
MKDDSQPPLVFTIGYKGWGTRSKEFLNVLEKSEKQRGFGFPFFADIRIHRSARARGFSGTQFEKLTGSGRYFRFKKLGNVNAKTGSGYPVKVEDPSAIGELLDLINNNWINGCRTVVFDGCPWPIHPQAGVCHRYVIGSLLLHEAKQRAQNLAVVEWPGGEPQETVIRVNKQEFYSIKKGRKSVPAGNNYHHDLVTLPWASPVRINFGTSELLRFCGPPQLSSRKNWLLPILETGDTTSSLEVVKRKAAEIRAALGLEPRSV